MAKLYFQKQPDIHCILAGEAQFLTKDQVAIDGEENVEYKSLCAECYYSHSNKTRRD